MISTNEKKIFIIIPAFNEEKTISEVVKNVKLYSDNIVVINDNSTDSTGTMAEEAGAIVANHKINKGYDGALNSGFSEAYKRGADIFITFDADGQHKHEDLKKVIEFILNGDFDLVIAQRSKVLHFCERIFAVYTNKFFNIKDPLCGLKAYTREVYEKTGYFDELNSIGTQLMLRAITMGFRFKLIPIVLNNRRDESRFYSMKIKANIKIFKAMIKIIINILKLRKTYEKN